MSITTDIVIGIVQDMIRSIVGGVGGAEESPAGEVLLEDGTNLLLEDGTNMLLEG